MSGISVLEVRLVLLQVAGVAVKGAIVEAVLDAEDAVGLEDGGDLGQILLHQEERVQGEVGQEDGVGGLKDAEQVEDAQWVVQSDRLHHEQ